MESSEVNAALLDILSSQVTFLHRYFDPDVSIPKNQADSITVPILDYLYDKELQTMVDARLLFNRQIRTLIDPTKPLTDFAVDVDEFLDRSEHSGTLTDRQMRNFRTLYRFRLDNLLHDHRLHYKQGYLPFYRFGRHKSFSDAVGNTMKQNIRRLYDLVGKLLDEQQMNDCFVCPCVILYNLFIRDNFRLFSLASTQHFNYVRILDDKTGRSAVISYVQLSNVFPQILQWFPNINNQYIKKYDSHSSKKLQYYLLLLLETSRANSNKNDNNNVASLSSSSLVLCKQKKTATKKRIKTTTKTMKKRKNEQKKIRIENLFNLAKIDDNLTPSYRLLDSLFRTNYVECSHANIGRSYVQIRSGDEEATLILRCLNCGRLL